MLRAVPRRHTVIGLGVVAIVGVRLFGELHGRTVSRRPLSSTTSMPHFSGVDTYDAPGQHSATLIFLHGLGDTSAGWAGEFRNLQRSMPHVRMVLPTAPISPVTLNGGMRMTSWHDIHSLQSIDSEKMAGLEESFAAIHELIDDEVKRGIPSNRIVIGGFSQGAALSLYSGLQYKSPLAGIISMSGYLPHYQTFATAKLSAANKQTPVLVCHGQADPVVHFVAGKTTHEILSRAGVPAQFKQYPGLGHGANAQELNDVREFVTKAIPPL
ncbi:unnamed protein product (mitochondrion) [Plasmodiophora brassicae]|uniref:palmitoyl-protein hydrolase n=1 Tax=Plasmodiophora brassicae TaxID=37360 RepID=A0A0G4J559_PLABS|nr:hypothetical protein PBRA_002647 [Plasmodiophora brassicae]SPQ94805.1 unnamed protein product [Plasmodiophora brassicae]